MKRKQLRSTLLILTFSTLFWGCPFIETVEQPMLACTESSFTTTITVALGEETGEFYTTPNFAVQLPLGWSMNDTLPFNGEIDGVFVYDSLFTDSSTVRWPPLENYYWWAGKATDSVFYAFDAFSIIAPIIFTDNQEGPFSLEYRVGDDQVWFGDDGFLLLSQVEDIIISPDSTPLSGDVYVSPDGNWGGAGTVNDPLQTIIEASLRLNSDSLNPGRIHLAGGTYAPSITGERFPVKLNSYTSLIGSIGLTVILNVEGTGSVVSLLNTEQASISSLMLTGGSGSEGGGIMCDNSSVVVSNVVITGNYAEFGAGIFCDSSSVTLTNASISDNAGQGVYCAESEVVIINSILWNQSQAQLIFDPYGGSS